MGGHAESPWLAPLLSGHEARRLAFARAWLARAWVLEYGTGMEKRRKHWWHTAGEYLTHWSVAGAILAVTGAAPEHWFATFLDNVHLPRQDLPPWLAHMDYRLVALTVGLSIIVGDNLWRHHRPAAPAATAVPHSAPEQQTTPTDQAAPKLPDKPSIAVLAFDNMSGDPAQEYFSDGISEDIITQLSRSPRLFVIARNSSFFYKGHAIDIKQVARELGVRYVLEGSVRRDPERIRINAQLIDAETGSHIWAEKYDQPLTAIFAVQDEMTSAVARAIEPAISRVEHERLSRRPPESLGAWEAYQLGLWHEAKHNATDNARAREHFQRTIKLDSRFIPAYDHLASTYLADGIVYASLPLSEAIRLSRQQSEIALSIDPQAAEAHHAMGWTVFMSGDLVSASAHFEQGLSIDPNNFRNRHQYAVALLFSGRIVEARALLSELLRLNPLPDASVPLRTHLVMSYYLEADYTSAVQAARRAIAAHPGHPWAYRWLAAALGQLGRTDEANEALHKAIELSPQSFKFYANERPPWMRPEDHKRMQEGLRKAGWKG